MNGEGATSQARGLDLPRLLHTYLSHHRQALRLSGLAWRRTPWANAMIAVVLGITLALPATLQALFANAARVGTGWQGDLSQISLFLRPGLAEDQALGLARHVGALPGIAEVRYISPKQALEEFQRVSGVTDALAYLDDNPLPAVLVVRPENGQTDVGALQLLRQRLSALPGVATAQLDLDWLNRLAALAGVVERGIALLGALLSLAVLLIVGNTIRLSVESRRDEIVVAKLLGASDGFVRRPFLYSGTGYGLAGGLLALGIVDGLLLGLNAPVVHLAALYHNEFRLQMLGPVPAALLLVGGSALGWLGAWLALGKHLRQAEPL